jgi:hypothetical protein
VFLSGIRNGSQRLADGQYRLHEHLQSLREKIVVGYFREENSLKSATVPAIGDCTSCYQDSTYASCKRRKSDFPEFKKHYDLATIEQDV